MNLYIYSGDGDRPWQHGGRVHEPEDPLPQHTW